MKEFGMNHIRTSHNPYSEDFLKLCDKYGILVVDELHIGKTQLEKTIQRHLYQGSALVILRSGDKPGKIELSVAGEKMKAKKLVLNTK